MLINMFKLQLLLFLMGKMLSWGLGIYCNHASQNMHDSQKGKESSYINDHGNLSDFF